MIDKAKGINVIPESEDKSIASLVPFMMLVSGPPVRPGQIFSARNKPGCDVAPSKKQKYIQMSFSCVDSGNGGPREKVYMFHADSVPIRGQEIFKAQGCFYFKILPTTTTTSLLFCRGLRSKSRSFIVSTTD